MIDEKPAKVQRADGAGPFVEITQVGRWTYDVGGVVDGIGIWIRMTGERVWGRRRAERRALKRLAEYRREQQRRRDVIVVHAEPTHWRPVLRLPAQPFTEETEVRVPVPPAGTPDGVQVTPGEVAGGWFWPAIEREAAEVIRLTGATYVTGTAPCRYCGTPVEYNLAVGHVRHTTATVCERPWPAPPVTESVLPAGTDGATPPAGAEHNPDASPQDGTNGRCAE